MKYCVIKETIIFNGKKEVWFLVEPKNKIIRFLINLSPFGAIWYSPHKDLKKAINEANLKTKGEYY